jgi:hypothetical protein
VTVVWLQESAPPAGSPPLDWLLLTDQPVTTAAEAGQVVDWYRGRWLIEVYIRTLKTGCRVEDLLLRTMDRLAPCLAAYAVMAWRVLYLSRLARTLPDLPAAQVLEPDEGRMAWVQVHPGQPPPATLTLRTAVRLIAQVGGFLARRGDGEPGVETLWRGLTRVGDALAGYDAFAAVGGRCVQ